MSEKSTGIAVFDLDGTITSKDTFLEFIKYIKGGTAFYAGLLLLLPYILLFYLKIYPNHRLKEKFFAYFFKGISLEELNRQGNDFSMEMLPKLCYKKAMNTLAWHQQQGHRVVILTASSGIWLSKWCEHNQIELIATAFEIKENTYTGKIEGYNCYGSRKKDILATILQKGDYRDSYGYGDSPADRHFLALVQKPHFGSLA